jgi:ubiquinone/menaquinone biosynthesis C-methylase UbiE
MKKNQVNPSTKVDYGQDMPGIIIATPILFILFLGLAFWQFNSFSVNQSNQAFIPAIVFALIAVISLTLAITGIWSSRFGKFILRDAVLRKLNFKGNEAILDIGCGRGLLLIEAAKRIPNGKAVGADIWDQNIEYKNTAQMVLNNARIEGVLNQVEIVTADVQSMHFADNSFDVVMTSLMMHHVPDKSKALSEMIRVLKPGGTIVIADVMSKQYAQLIQSLGIEQVKINFGTRLFFMPAYVTIGYKSN